FEQQSLLKLYRCDVELDKGAKRRGNKMHEVKRFTIAILVMVLCALALPSVSKADLLLTDTNIDVSGGTPIPALDGFSLSGQTSVDKSILLLAAGFDLTSTTSVDLPNSTYYHHRAPTLEPSSLVLFGLGIFTIAFLMRRRLILAGRSDSETAS
ncbi:MAG: PEP-CTERM sorting domain-containing protein, partial [Deltaproteobacteria bacterium]|nr:PEP-CTERM sorting domain-containing protein [Deltaproteobacteria bacterium]